MKNTRNYGIDVMKVCAMFMVVILHVLGQGGILSGSKMMSINYEVAWFMEIASYCAVNCFAMATGYLMIDKEFQYRRIIPLWLQVVFYTTIITSVLMICNYEAIGLTSVVKAIMPVTFKQYWYFTAYVGAFIFMPIINCAFTSIGQKVVLKSIMIICGVTTILSIANGDVFNLSNGYSALWLIIMYIVGGYIKKYGRTMEKHNKHRYLVGYCVCIIVTWVSRFLISYLTINIFGEARYQGLLISYTSPTILLSGICLFLYCQQLEITNSSIKKMVSLFSKLTFGIYIIHVNPYIFGFGAGKFAFLCEMNVLLLICGVLVSASCIFVLCGAIEYCRLKLFDVLNVNENIELGVSCFMRKIGLLIKKCCSTEI